MIQGQTDIPEDVQGEETVVGQQTDIPEDSARHHDDDHAHDYSHYAGPSYTSADFEELKREVGSLRTVVDRMEHNFTNWTLETKNDINQIKLDMNQFMIQHTQRFDEILELIKKGHRPTNEGTPMGKPMTDDKGTMTVYTEHVETMAEDVDTLAEDVDTMVEDVDTMAEDVDTTVEAGDSQDVVYLTPSKVVHKKRKKMLSRNLKSPFEMST